MAAIVGVGTVDVETVVRSPVPLQWVVLRWIIWAGALVLGQYVFYAVSEGLVFAWLANATVAILTVGVALWASGLTVGHGLTLVGLGLLPLTVAASRGFMPLWTSDVPVVAVVGAAIVVGLTFLLTRKPVVTEIAEQSTLATRNFYLFLLAIVGVLVAKTQFPEANPFSGYTDGNALQQFVRQSNRLNALARLQGGFDLLAITLALQAIVSAIPSRRSNFLSHPLRAKPLAKPSSAWKFIALFAGLTVLMALARPMLESIVFFSMVHVIPEDWIGTEWYSIARDVAGMIAMLCVFPILLLVGLPLRRVLTGWQRFAIPIIAGSSAGPAVANLAGMGLDATRIELEFVSPYLVYTLIVQVVLAISIGLFVAQIVTRRLMAMLLIGLIVIGTGLLLMAFENQFDALALQLLPERFTGQSGGQIARLLRDTVQVIVTGPASVAMGAVLWLCLTAWPSRSTSDAAV